ncbi:MAG: glutamine-hydrolyzing GMP synthase, partial [Verrucomicrobia bacterium A1]
MAHDWIAILDFGSQYSQLIARRVREQQVYCELIRFDTPAAKLAARRPKGIILSGGPASVYGRGAPHCDPEIFKLGIPVLGICYGMQLMAHALRGGVQRGKAREFGPASIQIVSQDLLFRGMPRKLSVWMSHGDQVAKLPRGFKVLARTPTCPTAAMAHPERRLFGLQFHPEVVHTPQGMYILRHFIFDACGCAADWKMSKFIEDSVAEIRARVGRDQVVCGLSGGVDSSVVAALIHRAIGKQLHCVFVDNGLLRHGEAEQVEDTFGKTFGMNLHVARSEDLFLRRLRGITDPETKRKIIG